MAKLLLYLHGFHSSPQSLKAQLMQQAVATQRPDIQLCMPQLAVHPQAAWQQIETLLKHHPAEQVGVVGSSLGGFLATRVSEQFGYKAVLVNPAVRPYELLSAYLGEQVHPYTGECYQLADRHIQELRELECEVLQVPERLWVLLQTEDEVLDYRQAVAKYANARLTVEPGGDHGFRDFERYPAQILDFLEL